MTDPDDIFAGIFGNLDGDTEERKKASRLEYEASLRDIREVVDQHVKGFENLGYDRNEALFFGGQLHVFLTNINNR